MKFCNRLTLVVGWHNSLNIKISNHCKTTPQNYILNKFNRLLLKSVIIHCSVQKKSTERGDKNRFGQQSVE